MLDIRNNYKYFIVIFLFLFLAGFIIIFFQIKRKRKNKCKLCREAFRLEEASSSNSQATLVKQIFRYQESQIFSNDSKKNKIYYFLNNLKLLDQLQFNQS